MFKIKDINNGFFQITYEVKNELGESIYYALQNTTRDEIRLMRCSQPHIESFKEYYEPSHVAYVKEGVIIDIELPTGNSHLELSVCEYIKINPQMNGISM